MIPKGYKHSDEIKRKISKTMKKAVLEGRNLTIFKKGHKTWNKGKHLSKSQKDKIGENARIRIKKFGHPKGMLGKHHTEIFKKIQSIRLIKKIKERWLNPEYRDKMEKYLKSPEMFKKRLKGLIKRPNKPEKYLDDIIQSNFPNEFQYTGDGKVIINNLCPDFTNCNGQKKVIEVFGDYWHSGNRQHMTLEEREKRFAEFGYKMLIIWENELKTLSEQEIIDRIKIFIR